MSRMFIRFVLALWVGGLLSGQNTLRLKNRLSVQERRDAKNSIGMQRLRSTRGHMIVEIGPDTPAEWREILNAKGAQVLRAVPDDGVLIAAPLDLDVQDLHLRRMREMNASEKLSIELNKAQPVADYVVEFHPDVEPAEARAIVAKLGLVIRENPDVLPGHLLVEGNLRNLLRLAQWDEVAYVFPASPELINGQPVHGCSGAITGAGAIGQYIATYGDGWDGPGRNAASLNYAFSRLTQKQPRDAVVSVISDVMAEWAAAAKLTFTYTDRTDGPRTLNFLFAAGNHGDSYPFDGPGKVLAHTYYPAPPNPEPVAGDLHFDDDEHWSIGADIDLFSVVLHEMGHALGLGHADKPGAVMYPYYSRVSKLTGDDIAAIQQLYAAPGETPAQPLPLSLTVSAPASTTSAVVGISGTVSGGVGETRVTWRTDAGASGTATGVPNWSAPSVPVVAGRNTVTFSANDTQGRTASQTAVVTRTDPAPAFPQIAITAPVSTNVTGALITISGTASAPGGLGSVRWANSRGGSGVATGTTSWSARITLLTGQNVITVSAIAVSGTQTSVSITLNYASVPAIDTTAPSLTITSPSSTIVATTATSIRIAGTSRDNVGVTEVTWSTASGGYGVASGTANWSATLLLLVGDNNVTVRAKDAAGNVGWRSLTVTRK